MIGKVRRKNLKSAIVCLTWAQLSNVHLRKMNTMVSFKICFTISKSRKNKGHWPIPALCLFLCTPTVICPLWRPFQTYSWQWKRWWQYGATLILHWCFIATLHCYYIASILLLHCYIATTLLLYCYYIATILLLHCYYIGTILLLLRLTPFMVKLKGSHIRFKTSGSNSYQIFLSWSDISISVFLIRMHCYVDILQGNIAWTRLSARDALERLPS